LFELGDCLDLIIDHRGKTPQKLGGNWTSIGIKAISAKNVHGGRLSNQDDIRYVSEEMYKKWMKEDVKEGDCLLASEGATLGEYLYWDFNFPVVLSQRLFCIRTNPKVLDPKYFYAFVTTNQFQNQITGRASGTSVFGLRQSEVRKMLVPIIPINRQKAIGEIHYIINRKIDLLHRQNKTLEQMAETLFRQWFVEEVKEDWEERPLSSIATFLNGLACQKFPPQNEVDKLPVLKIKQLRNGFNGDEDWCTTDVKPEYTVESGDIIFSWSASLMVKIWDGQTCILNQHLFKVMSNEFPKWFYYLWCKHHLAEFISISTSHATTMGHIKRGDLDDAMVIIPDESTMNVYSDIASPLLEKIIAINKQLHTLKNLRDVLLPKLMTGEVTISDE
jgi:type I restriction enzyme S subunit